VLFSSSKHFLGGVADGQPIIHRVRVLWGADQSLLLAVAKLVETIFTGGLLANAPGQIPNRRVARTGVEQCVIGFAVTIEIRDIYDIPANRESRTVRAAEKNVVVHVPHRRLASASLIGHIVWFAIVVEVTSWCRTWDRPPR